MRCHVAQPNHCVALGTRQDRLVAGVSVRQATLCSRSGFVKRFGQLATFGWCYAGGRSPVAAMPAAMVDMRATIPVAVRMRGMVPAEGRRREVASR